MKTGLRGNLVLSLAILIAACGPTAEPIIVRGGERAAGLDEASSSQPATLLSTGAVSAAIGQETIIPDEGRDHVPQGTTVEYKHYPPASGPHYEVVLEYGLYEGEDVPPEYWVHNLEHGAIVILYKCAEPCPDLVDALGDMLDLFPLSKWDNRKIVIAPYSRMDTPLMAVAWNVQMPLDRFDRQALIDFYARHVDRGPEDLP